MSNAATLEVLDHPVAGQLLSRLRDKSTPPAEFARVLALLSHFLAYSASRRLLIRTVPVETPLETTQGIQLAQPIVLIPILRAGLGLMEGFTRFFPEATIGHIGLARDEKTLRPRPYLEKLPQLEDRTVFLLDPMLATGGSASHAIRQLKDSGAKSITLVSVIAAPEGVRKIQTAHPEVAIVTASLDRQLDERGYILPGLGDAGDRLCGTLG
jgi:uracil phosphoribosyltransferase